MRRPRGIVLVLLLILVGGTLAMLRFGTGMHVSGFVTVRVTGRLIEGATGAPVPATWVLVLPSRSWAQDQRTLIEANEDAHFWDRMRHIAGTEFNPDGRMVGPFEAGGAVTGAGGAFGVEITHRWSQHRSGILDPGNPLPPRYHTEAILIEIDGRKPVLLDAPHGTWTEHPDDDDLWATYDMGVIRVPPEK